MGDGRDSTRLVATVLGGVPVAFVGAALCVGVAVSLGALGDGQWPVFLIDVFVAWLLACVVTWFVGPLRMAFGPLADRLCDQLAGRVSLGRNLVLAGLVALVPAGVLSVGLALLDTQVLARTPLGLTLLACLSALVPLWLACLALGLALGAPIDHLARMLGEGAPLGAKKTPSEVPMQDADGILSDSNIQEGGQETPSEEQPMVEFVKPERVFLECPATTVDEALRFIAEKAVEVGVGTDADAIYTALRTREDMGATGMTDGYAIPHCMCPEIEETSVVVLKFADAPEWKTMDGNPVVYAISLLVSSLEGTPVHLELLSTIARVLTHPNFRTEMESATTAEEISAAINKRLHD